jgi:hypothetical protein
VTLDPNLREIFAAADETIAELDRLNAASDARRTDHRADLRAIVARLDQGTTEEPPEPPAERRQRDDDRRRPAQESEPFVALPERTTPGGPFGPKVRDLLVAEALAKRQW